MIYTLELLDTFDKIGFSLRFKPIKQLTMMTLFQVRIGTGEVPKLDVGIKYKATKDCTIYAKLNEHAELCVCSDVAIDSRLRLQGSFCVDATNPRSGNSRFGMGMEWLF